VVCSEAKDIEFELDMLSETAWDPRRVKDIDKPEMVQRRAARFAKLLFFKFIKEVSKMCHLIIKYYLTIRQGKNR